MTLNSGGDDVHEHCLDVALTAARAGGEALLEWVGRFSVQEKGPADLVTQADLASQEAIRRTILEHFPRHHFLGEEGEAIELAGLDDVWIVDPLDGTTNYVHQIPHYAVSIAYAHRGVVQAAVIYDPVSKDTYSAKRGRGAVFNGQPARVSTARRIADALVAASFAARVSRGSVELAQFNAVVLEAQAVRRTGSAALNMAYVAVGRFDAFWALSTKIWDVAAGALLVEEAGGCVTDPAGRPFDLSKPHLVATASQSLHEEFLTLLQRSAE